LCRHQRLILRLLSQSWNGKNCMFSQPQTQNQRMTTWTNIQMKARTALVILASTNIGCRLAWARSDWSADFNQKCEKNEEIPSRDIQKIKSRFQHGICWQIHTANYCWRRLCPTIRFGWVDDTNPDFRLPRNFLEWNLWTTFDRIEQNNFWKLFWRGNWYQNSWPSIPLIRNRFHDINLNVGRKRSFDSKNWVAFGAWFWLAKNRAF
jgi:hypothetical protein